MVCFNNPFTMRSCYWSVLLEWTEDTEDARFDLNASRPIAKGDLKWRDALLVAHRVNSNKYSAPDKKLEVIVHGI